MDGLLGAASNPARPTSFKKGLQICSPFLLRKIYSVGSLAQLVEQRTLNPLVAGSNPARPTSIKKGSGEILGPFPFLNAMRAYIEAKLNRL